ncbi:MAG: LysR family transcriptional regulator [Planctomycetota bacterium]
MEPQQLRAFLAVAHQGSFSAAAEQLALTQPAVTKRVKALESALATQLFDRLGRDVQLTEAGELLRPRAEDILQRIADATQALTSAPDEVGGELQVATSHHIGLHRLAPVLRAFRGQFPNVRLDMRFEDSEVGHTLVRRGSAELAVVTLDPTAASAADALAATTLWSDPLTFIAAAPEQPEVASIARDGVASLEELARRPTILPGPSTYTGQLIRDLFARASLRLSASMQTNYLETIRMLVAAGYGWSALPRTMLAADVVPFEVPGVSLPQRALGYVVHRRRSLSHAARAFIEVLEQFAD